MRDEYIIYGLLAFVIVILAYSVSGLFIGSNQAKTDMIDDDILTLASEQSFSSISTGSTGQGDVSIELAPMGIINGKFEVDIAANTHSVDLSQFDLKKITTLNYGTKTVTPIDAPSLSGHHTSGTLVFDITEGITVFTINIMDIPKLKNRVFEWR